MKKILASDTILKYLLKNIFSSHTSVFISFLITIQIINISIVFLKFSEIGIENIILGSVCFFVGSFIIYGMIWDLFKLWDNNSKLSKLINYFKQI